MARYRMIKPEFWEDDKFGECSPTARLLFLAMLNFADDEGYLEHRVKWLKAKCLPYDDAEIDALLTELYAIGRIEVRNGIIWIKNFLKHQKVEKPRPSDLSQKFKVSVTPPRKLTEESPPKDKISKEKLSEEISTIVNGDKSPDEVNEIFKIFYQINPTIKFGSKTCRAAVVELVAKFGFENTKKFAESAVALHGVKFAPTITTPYQLKEKLSVLVAYLKANSTGQNNLITSS